VPALAVYLDDNPLGDFRDKLRPEPGELVATKQYGSAFCGMSLSATLTAIARDCLLITGFSTSGCVRVIALEAWQHGFIPYVGGMPAATAPSVGARPNMPK
jgi:maleamate amidohydrolase